MKYIWRGCKYCYLPEINSLSAVLRAEQISRYYLRSEKADAVINILASTSLEWVL